MLKNNKLTKAVRLALVLGATSSVAFTGTVNAQEAEESAKSVERISVTGSRIIRAEFDSASPIAVFDSKDLSKAGVTGVDEFLKDVPAFTGYQMGTSTNNGSAEGQKKIDMRGLGFNRTLVLINGRRMIGDASGDGAVDLNNIPMSMVKRVEVLKDGASTIYGTDAIAGVVNIILHDNFEGVEASASYGGGVAERDAVNKSFSVMGGVAGDKGNFVAAIEYNRQNELLQGERPEWAKDALYPQRQADGSFLAVGSGSSNGRKINLPGVGNFVFDPTTGKARPFAASDVYNYAPVNAIITPNERWQFATNGSYNIDDKTKVYFDSLYTRRTSQQRLAPDASFAVTPNFAGTGVWNDFVPRTNPYNPFGNAAAGPDGVMGTADDLNSIGVSGQDVRVNRRFVESGGRLFQQAADTFRMTLGTSGAFTDNIFWDMNYSYSETDTINDTKNYHRFDRWAVAVDPAKCSANPTCAAAGVLNPFGDYGSITAEQMTFLSASSLKDWYRGAMSLFQAGVSGDNLGIELPGGSVGWALGAEQRYEKGSFIPDEFVSEGLTTGGAGDPLNGNFTVSEYYGELYAPLLETLVMETSVRFSDYNTSAGSTTNYKVGFDWAALESLKIRTGYATGFRAPNIAELNQGDSTGFPLVEFPCEFADIRGDVSQTVIDNCRALGADTSVTGEFGYAWQSAYTTKAPSIPLKPEESTSFTIGAVWTVPMVEGLTASIDYFDIEIENFISSIPYNDLLLNCLESTGLAAPSCDLFVNGSPVDGGAPADATSEIGNLGIVSTDGIDFDIAYDTAVAWGAISGFNARLSGTYVLSRTEDWPLTGKRDLVGTADGFAVYPELRMSAGLGVTSGDWGLSWDLRYIGETDDAKRPATITDDAVAEAIVYHDLTGTYSYNNLSVLVGINNLFDKNPPRFHSAFNANTEPGTYDVIGRRLFVQGKVSF